MPLLMTCWMEFGFSNFTTVRSPSWGFGSVLVATTGGFTVCLATTFLEVEEGGGGGGGGARGLPGNHIQIIYQCTHGVPVRICTVLQQISVVAYIRGCVNTSARVARVSVTYWVDYSTHDSCFFPSQSTRPWASIIGVTTSWYAYMNTYALSFC